MEPSLHIPEKVPRPLPCPHHFLSISISKTPTLSCLLFSVEATRRLECKISSLSMCKSKCLISTVWCGRKRNCFEGSAVLVLFDYPFGIFLFPSSPSVEMVLWVWNETWKWVLGDRNVIDRMEARWEGYIMSLFFFWLFCTGESGCPRYFYRI
jgi:hypothetical protein